MRVSRLPIGSVKYLGFATTEPAVAVDDAMPIIGPRLQIVTVHLAHMLKEEAHIERRLLDGGHHGSWRRRVRVAEAL
jgi:hypothetical protein